MVVMTWLVIVAVGGAEAATCNTTELAVVTTLLVQLAAKPAPPMTAGLAIEPVMPPEVLVHNR